MRTSADSITTLSLTPEDYLSSILTLEDYLSSILQKTNCEGLRLLLRTMNGGSSGLSIQWHPDAAFAHIQQPKKGRPALSSALKT